MKYSYIIVIGLISLLFLEMVYSSENRASNKPTLKLTGQIESCEATDEGDRVKVSLKLNLSLTNAGDTPILLMSEKPTLIGRQISSPSVNEQDEKSLFTLWRRPSIGKNDEWLKLSKDINKASPPEAQIKRIEVGDAIKWEVTDWFYISKDDKSSWKELAAADRLSLRLTYEMWSLNIEPQQSTLDDKKFGQELRERWKSYGYLWIDEITSEPIDIHIQASK